MQKEETVKQVGSRFFGRNGFLFALVNKLEIIEGYAAIDDFLLLPSEGSPSDDQCSVLPQVKIIIDTHISMIYQLFKNLSSHLI